MPSCEHIYALSRWGEGYFHINDAGRLCVRPDPQRRDQIDLVELTERVRDAGLALPVLVRFNDILRHRVRSLVDAFQQASAQAGYQGRYTPAYPIKVNQQRSVIEQLLRDGLAGLEAGSKPELMAVLAVSAADGLVICNGYKDREYLRLALIGGQLGLRLFIVIEKPSELAMALEEARRLGVDPVFGVRVRLAAEAAGNWQSSGGEKAKFGLNPQQLLQLIEDLKQAGKLHCLRLLHAHLGSQIPTLRDIRKGLRELARYYSELRRLGAPIDNVDVGGGLGVDYEGTGSRHYCSIDYNLRAYASAVTDALKAVCQQEGLPHPNIISESGRAMTAHHAVLITHVSDREEGEAAALAPLQHASPLLASLQENLSLCAAQPLAAFENARAWLAQARSAFDAGQSSLAERAHAESLFKQTCSALRQSLSGDSLHERELLDQINALLATKLFCNFSLFQSMPDIWGIEQIFPIAPLQRLNELPQRRALLHDLTCDSDGCIKRYVDQDGIEASLPVHEAKPGEDYLLGFFLIGAYQEILGDMHNLFGDTDAVNAELCADGGYRLLEPERGDSVDELLRYVHFSPRSMLSAYRRKLQAADLAADTREHYAAELKAGLFGYSYLEE